jgi:receptor expression-enhancing protein 5/6
MVSLWNVLVQLYKVAGPVVILAYPLYASVMAIESFSKEDETQWLTYWVLYSLIQLLEIALERVLYWIPFWYALKLVAISWLVLPQFHGAAFIYENYVKKYIGGMYAGKNEKLTPKQRELIEQISPQARASVSAFITEYGANAFDQVITAATSKAAQDRS